MNHREKVSNFLKVMLVFQVMVVFFLKMAISQKCLQGWLIIIIMQVLWLSIKIRWIHLSLFSIMEIFSIQYRWLWHQCIQIFHQWILHFYQDQIHHFSSRVEVIEELFPQIPSQLQLLQMHSQNHLTKTVIYSLQVSTINQNKIQSSKKISFLKEIPFQKKNSKNDWFKYITIYINIDLLSFNCL